MQKSRKNRKGFTLVELMVVVVIIGILTAIAIPVYMSVTANALAKACLANQRTIDSAVMVYLAEAADADDPTVLHTLAAVNADPEGVLVSNYLAVWPTPDCGCTYGVDVATGLCTWTTGDKGTAAHELHPAA